MASRRTPWGKLATALPVAAAAGIAVRDLTQRRHSLLRTYPLVGHARYLLERIGPELRQYIVADNDEERPFSRDQRSWIYASAKLENNYVGFGTDADLDNTSGHAIIKHRTFGTTTVAPGAAHAADAMPSAKVLGGPRGRRHAFRPVSAVNVSGMSYGALSGPAIESINRGCAAAGALHNTGEGGLSAFHRNGADLVFQIGTAYFGCRDAQGRFELSRLVDLVASAPVRALEIKLSQGAKPGLGGMLPGAKVTSEVAGIRGIPVGEDCASPSRHTAFHDVDSMLDFVETLAEATGLPVGIKSAVGHSDFWDDLVVGMASGTRGVDFITVDGGEGGTGAAPLVFTDSVALPLRPGFAKVYRRFAASGLAGRITFVASGKLGLPDNALVAFALGADMVNVAREAMLAIGCIQAQKCHTDRCPTGVATQNPWLRRGIDPALKSERLANYLRTLRRDLLTVSEAVGVAHPALLTTGDIDVLVHGAVVPLHEAYEYDKGWGLPAQADLDALAALLAAAQ